MNAILRSLSFFFTFFLFIWVAILDAEVASGQWVSGDPGGWGGHLANSAEVMGASIGGGRAIAATSTDFVLFDIDSAVPVDLTTLYTGPAPDKYGVLANPVAIDLTGKLAARAKTDLLTLMDVSTGEIKRMRNLTLEFGDPIRLAFLGASGNLAIHSDSGLFVIDSMKGELVWKIKSSSLGKVSFSKESGRILLTNFDDQVSSSLGAGAAVYSPRGDAVAVLPTAPGYAEGILSPDGSHVLLHDYRLGRTSLWSVDPLSLKWTAAETVGQPIGAFFQSDGTEFAFNTRIGSEARAEVWSATETGYARTTTFSGSVALMGSDGTLLLHSGPEIPLLKAVLRDGQELWSSPSPVPFYSWHIDSSGGYFLHWGPSMGLFHSERSPSTPLVEIVSPTACSDGQGNPRRLHRTVNLPSADSTRFVLEIESKGSLSAMGSRITPAHDAPRPFKYGNVRETMKTNVEILTSDILNNGGTVEFRVKDNNGAIGWDTCTFQSAETDNKLLPWPSPLIPVLVTAAFLLEQRKEGHCHGGPRFRRHSM